MKNIFLLGPEFFGYTDRIGQKLAETNSVKKIYTFYPKGILNRLLKTGSLESYYDSIEIGSNFDQILIINGKYIPEKFIDKLRDKNPKAQLILYIWDDFENANHSQSFLEKFDLLFTYSKGDSENFKYLKYQPFFYSDLERNDYGKDIALSFVGSLHSNRLKVYKQIAKEISGAKYLYLYSEWINFFKSSRNWKLFRDVKFRSLPYVEYVNILKRSKISIEIPHVNQKNITTRAIEVLGTGTKLITTSKIIKQYDFYEPQNIFVLEGDNYKDIQAWSRLPYEKIDSEVLEKYSIESWCKAVTEL